MNSPVCLSLASLWQRPPAPTCKWWLHGSGTASRWKRCDAKAAAYLAKHPDDKDSTQKELQEEQETLLEEIAALKIPLTEVQEDLKKLRDIRYWVRKATPGTEESKEPPKKQPIKEVLQDKADEKKAQRTAPAQAKHRQQDSRWCW